jgi:voltage-gated potassium channel
MSDRQDHEQPQRDVWAQILKGFHYWNNLLLLPLFVSMVLELSYEGSEWADESRGLELFFCLNFLAEWALGLALAPNKRQFLRDPVNIVDLVSSVPFALIFQSVRVVRLVRVVRVLRLATRAQRFKGKGSKLIRAAGLMASVTFSGALAFRIVEPQSTAGFEESLWWSLVTLSTVGYGDIRPITPAGHIVAGLVIIAGLGVIGYTAGFMTSLMHDDEADNELLVRVKALDEQLTQIKLALASLTRDKQPGA